MASIIQTSKRTIVVGVDTHKAFHVAAVKDELGHDIGEARFEAAAVGYEELRAWANTLGRVEAFGIEGPGSYGSGLARHLQAAGKVSSRWDDRAVSTERARASPTLPTPVRPLRPCSPATPWERPSLLTDRSR